MKQEIDISSHLRERLKEHLSWTRYTMVSIGQNLKALFTLLQGAGGAPLYDTRLSEKPELWKHEPTENWPHFTKKLISDRHSFTLIETKGKILTLQQIDLTGKVIDEIKVTR